MLILALGGSRGHSKDGTVTLENGPSPSAPRGALATVGGSLPSAFKPRLRLRQGPPSGMVLLMVADVVRLPHVTHAGLAARDPTCRPPLQGVVSPQKVELSAGTKGSIKHIMVQNGFGLVHKSLQSAGPKITHGVLILAPGGSRDYSKDWTITLENGASPSAPRGVIATAGGGLASAFKRRLRLRQGPPLRDGAPDGPAPTLQSCRPCRERPDLSSPPIGCSVSTERGTIGRYEGLY